MKNQFLTLLRKTSTDQPKPFVCKRPQGEGAVCGLQFSKLSELRDHREVCAWVCPVEGCGKKAKKERDILQHKSKHRVNEARRAAILSHIEANLISWLMMLKPPCIEVLICWLKLLRSLWSLFSGSHQLHLLALIHWKFPLAIEILIWS